MTMITPSYLGETIEYSSLHACRSTLEDPTPFRGMRGLTPAALRGTLSSGQEIVLDVRYNPAGIDVRIALPEPAVAVDQLRLFEP